MCSYIAQVTSLIKTLTLAKVTVAAIRARRMCREDNEAVNAVDQARPAHAERQPEE